MQRLPGRALAALIAIAGARSASAGVIDLDERASLIMLAMTPSGAVASTRASELYAAADRVLRASTTLMVRSPEQAGIDLGQVSACPLETRLSCWISNVRAPAPYLLVLSIHPLGEGGERMTAMLIDVASALRAADEIPRSEDGWQTRLEDRIFERAVQARPTVVRPEDAGALDAYFQRLFTEELAARFEGSGHAEPFGSIRLTGAPAGVAIELDGRSAGLTAAGDNTLTGLAPRTRKLVLTDPAGRFAALTRDVTVEAGRSTELAVEMLPITQPGLSPRTAAVWGGTGLAGAGAVLAVVAIAAAPATHTVTGGGPGEDTRFATFCELGSSDPATCGPGGVRAAPLAYSIALAGGITALGALFFTTEEDAPWLPALAGACAGALAYGLTTALE